MKKILLFSLFITTLCTLANAQLSVFSDSYGAGATFADFGGSINAVSIDNTVAHTGTSSIKAIVPSSSYTGGAFKAATNQNLSTYNAISFWVKASASKTLNVSGISNNGTTAVYQAEYNNLAVSTTWTKYIIPIPAASKLTAEDGLFHFAEGSDEGPYTLWFDDIQYENSAAVGAYSPSIVTQTVTPAVGGTFGVTVQPLTVLVNGVSQTIAVNLACYSFMSSNTAIATIGANGTGAAVAAGTATITASLGSVTATGTLTVVVAGGGGGSGMPMVAAPTPTTPAANVISLFSNAYTNVAGTDWFPNWGQSTVVTDVLIAGNDTKKYANLNYQGIIPAAALNVSSMQFLHIDIWTPNCTAFDVFLINPGPVEQKVTVNPTASGWNSYNIPLSSYPGVNLANVFQIKLEGAPFGTSTVYMDNMYFYTGAALATMPTTAAPTPTRLPAYVQSLYSNAYTNLAGTDWFPNWGQSTIVTDVQIAGNDTKKYATLNYQGVQFAAPVNASSMEFLHIDLWTPNCTAFEVYLINPGPIEQKVTLSPTLSGWNSFDIPLSSYNTIALNNIIQFKLVGTPFGTSTVWFDNMYFYRNPALLPTTAAPTPTRLPAYVQSLYSNAYTNLAGTDWFPNWGQSTVVTDVQIAGNDTKKYATLNYQGVQFAAPVDASTMEFLHLDLWTPNCTAFDVYLINAGGIEQKVTVSPTLSGWNSFDIPLSSYNTINLASIIQFKLVGTPFGTSTVWFDNMYFYKNPPTAPLAAAPNPAPRPAPNVISLFSGAYTDVVGTDWFPNWGQSTVVTDVQIAGNTTKRYSNLNYQGIQFASSINASGMEKLHFDLWTGNCSSFDVYLINTSPATIEQKVTVTPTAFGWNSYDIPLSSYNIINLASIAQIKLVGTPAGCTLFLDNIYFYNTPNLSVSTTAVTVAAPANSLATFILSSNTAWTITSNQPWLSVITPSGAGNSTATLSAQENVSVTATRTATVTVSAPGIPNQIITVTQSAATPVIYLSATALTIAAPANSTKTFDISSNATWDVSSSATWLSFDKTTGTGNTVVTISAQENPTIAIRTATVTVTAPNVAPKTIVVTQQVGLATLSVSAPTLSVAAPANSTKTFNITSNSTWTTSSNQTWLSLDKIIDTGNATVTITAQANPNVTTRTATVTITAPNAATKTIVVTQAAAAPALSVSASDVTIAAPVNSTKTVDISSNTAWTTSSNATWLTIDKASGTANGTITLTAQANLVTSARSTTVVVTIGSISKTINVVQEASAAILTLSSNALSIASPANSTKAFDVISNTNWTAVSSETWLTLSAASGTNNTAVTLTAQANPNITVRTATVTVSAVGTTDKILTVTQDASGAILVLSASTLTIAAPANSTKTFDITSNINWTATSSENWLALSAASGTKNGTLTLTAQANPTTATRTATITIAGNGVGNQTVVVTQEAGLATLSVSAATLSIAAPANSTKTFDITSNTNWTVASSDNWLAVVTPSGANSGTVTLTAQANTTITPRTATITVAGTGTTSKTITVTQDAAAPTLGVSTNNITIAAPANSTQSFDIISNIQWTIATSQPWIKLSLTGGKTITATAEENPNTTTRQAIITIKGAGVPDQIVTVTQEASKAALTVSVATLTIAAPANSTKTFDIAATTTWTVTSSATWLVANTLSGSGNATVTLTAQANTTNAIRTATVTIKGNGVADKTIVVTQSFLTGTNDLLNKITFTVYPNPVENDLILKLNDANISIQTVIVNDLSGKMLMKLGGFEGQKTIDVSALSQGVYFIHLIEKNTQAVSNQKFIKL